VSDENKIAFFTWVRSIGPYAEGSIYILREGGLRLAGVVDTFGASATGSSR
jgi:hypothetical protein